MQRIRNNKLLLPQSSTALKPKFFSPPNPSGAVLESSAQLQSTVKSRIVMLLAAMFGFDEKTPAPCVPVTSPTNCTVVENIPSPEITHPGCKYQECRTSVRKGPAPFR